MMEVPANIALPREVMYHAWQHYPGRVALRSPGWTLTFEQLHDRVAQLVHALHGMGLQKGDVCFVQLAQAGDLLLASQASMQTGIILVGIPHACGRPVLEFFCQQVAPKGFLFEASGEADAAILRERVAGISLCCYDDLPRKAPHAEPLALAALPAMSPHDRGLIGFSSGTTGAPKVLQASYGTYLTGVRLLVRHVWPSHVSADPVEPVVMLAAIPIAGAGSGVVLPTWFGGGTLVLPEQCTADEILRLVPLHRVTSMFVTPSVLIDLLDHPRLAQTDLSSLRNILYGTELMPAAKLEEALRRFGPILHQGYGSAEVLPPVTLLQPEEHMANGVIAPRSVLTSVGKAVPEVQVIIADDDDQALPTNAIGNVLIKSPTQFKGYLNRPEVNAQVQRGGWLHIGDIGYLDHDGYLHILGRGPDLIRRNGVITYPRYAEEAMHDHPAVKETAFVQMGEQGVMAVSLRRAWRHRLQDPTLRAELLAFVCTHVCQRSQPDAVWLLEELPRSPLGKVLRREVREQLTEHMKAPQEVPLSDFAAI